MRHDILTASGTYFDFLERTCNGYTKTNTEAC
jgi:hypothetical protein